MKAVLFDLDGTLLNTLDDLADSANFALRALDLPERSRADVRRFVGNGVRVLMERALPAGKDGLLEDAVALFCTHYQTHNAVKTKPYPKTQALLERLKEDGFALAIVSNKPDGAVKALAATFFPAVHLAVGERAGVARKPAPDMVQNALALLGVLPENAVYVGDSEVDIQTAQNASLPCVSVTWGFRDAARLKEAGATHVCDDTASLYETIRRLCP